MNKNIICRCGLTLNAKVVTFNKLLNDKKFRAKKNINDNRDIIKKLNIKHLCCKVTVRTSKINPILENYFM